MATEADLLNAFEVHSPEDIQNAFDAGVGPVRLIKGKRPIDCLIEVYLRSARFAGCIRVMLSAGAEIGNPVLQSLLLDDAAALSAQIRIDPTLIMREVTALTAFTSCEKVTALHLCAEFNSISCAKLLISSGADVNASAPINAAGFGGQSPTFHAVNSIFNYCRPQWSCSFWRESLWM